MRLNISTLFLASFSALSAALLVAEMNSFSESQAYSGQNAAISVPTRLKPALSNRAIHHTLLACDRSMASPIANFQPMAQLQETAGFCADFAKRVTRWAPTHGFAYFVTAQAAQIQGDFAARAISLEKSRLFAPFEGWIAERRVGLIANQISPDIAVTAPQMNADIASLLNTQSGAELLAAIYLHRAEFRPLLASVSEHASTRNQTRFMNQIHQRQTVN